MSGTAPLFNRRDLVAGLLADRPADLLVVTGLGSPTYDVAAAGDHELNFYLWGAMGSAVTVGLGLALARPDNRVLVVTGDGEMLMALGALATIGVKRPANLAIAVIDNGRYGETGGQASHTDFGVDIPAAALSCRFARASTFFADTTAEQARDFLLRDEGPALASFKVDPTEHPRVMPTRDGHALRHRFRVALSGSEVS